VEVLVSQSHAKQALVCDPFGCALAKDRAERYWQVSNFIGFGGVEIRAVTVHHGPEGQLSVEFPDGSILNRPHWQM
jgi:hypothetical protein